MAALVASAGGGADQQPATATDTAATTPRAVAARAERLSDEQEVISFLFDHFVPTEPILASLHIECKSELCTLLSDIVRDCLQCSSSLGIRDENGKLAGVCLASKSSLFDKQVDRLWTYTFSDEKMRIAIEFLKYVFNRVDVVFHCQERQIYRPVFIAVVSVRADRSRSGIGSALLEQSLQSAAGSQSDGALLLCSSARAMKLISKQFKGNDSWALCRIRYSDYRGEYREPPIVPPDEDHSLHVMLKRLSPPS